MNSTMNTAFLEVQDLKIHFPVRGGTFGRVKAYVKAVDGVSLSIDKGDTLGLVGESGSGKTTLANGINMLEPLTAGKVVYDGHDLSRLSRKERKAVRSSMQIVFQDPFWSLNPRWLVRDIVGEPLRVHKKLRGQAYQDGVVQALEMVGLSGADLFKYPHEFAGGLRQRVAIARALAAEPDLLLLDEPTSAVDVLSQHQILLMLQELKERLGLTFILVSHDLSVVGYLATKIAVMYCGRVVEWGPCTEVFAAPMHPYTEPLFASVPDPKVLGVGGLVTLPGEVASVVNPPLGCRFHDRCTRAMEKCAVQDPPKVTKGEDHIAYCWAVSGTLLDEKA